MRKLSLVLFLILATMLSFAACHSGGNNNPIATTNPEPTTNPTTTNPPNPTPALLPILTGVFVDAPVEGLTYTSGAATGTTNASGTFKFEEGGSVQFKLGNVVLGQALGKALMTPLDLVQAIDSAATITDPRVVQIVQFLMTVDASPTAAAMLMPALAAANAANVTAVNLSAGLVDLAPIVSAITTHTLVTPAAAAAHLLALATVTTPTQGVFAALDSPTNPKLGMRLAAVPNLAGDGFDISGVVASINGQSWSITGTLTSNGSLQATGTEIVPGTSVPPTITVTGAVASATQISASVAFLASLRSFLLEKAVAPPVAAQVKFGLLTDPGVPPVAGDLVHAAADMTVKPDGSISAHLMRGQVTGVVALAAIYSSHFANLDGIVTSTGNIIAMGGTPGNGEALNLNGKTLTNVSPVTFFAGALPPDGTPATVTITAQDLNLAGPAATPLLFTQTTSTLVGVYQGTHSDTAPGLPSTFTFGVNIDNGVHGFTMFLRQRPADIQQTPYLLDGVADPATGVLAPPLGFNIGALGTVAAFPGLVMTDQEGGTGLTPGTFAGSIISTTGLTNGTWQTGPGVLTTGTFTGNLLP